MSDASAWTAWGLEMHPEFGDAHHDLVVLPDESVGFPQYMGGRDRLMERAPDGTVRMIVDVPMAHGGTTNNHANSIQYYAPDDSYTFSDLDQNCYVKVSRQGQVAWVLGGDTSDFTGAGRDVDARARASSARTEPHLVLQQRQRRAPIPSCARSRSISPP